MVRRSFSGSSLNAYIVDSLSAMVFNRALALKICVKKAEGRGTPYRRYTRYVVVRKNIKISIIAFCQALPKTACTVIHRYGMKYKIVRGYETK